MKPEVLKMGPTLGATCNDPGVVCLCASGRCRPPGLLWRGSGEWLGATWSFYGL